MHVFRIAGGAAHLDGDLCVHPVAARLVHLARRVRLASSPRRIDRLISRGRHLLQQFTQVCAAFRSTDAFGRLLQEARLDLQSGEPREVRRRGWADRIGGKVAGRLAGDDGPLLVHGHP